MTKFYEEFIKSSNGKFPMLKFSSATYFKSKRELIVRFIISAYEIKDFGEDKKGEVLAVLKEMFNGLDIKTEYIRTFADTNTVKNKILEFFNRCNQLAFSKIKDDTMEISVNESDIYAALYFDTPIYKMLVSADVVTSLTEILDISFNQNIDVELFERAEQSDSDNEEFIMDTVAVAGEGARLVSLKTGEKIYSKTGIAGISQMPNYIIDVKGASDNITLCGKITNISKRMYKNKKYTEGNTKSGPPELPLVRFMLDDTTAKIECVCFPNSLDAANQIEAIPDRTEVVCAGNVGLSAYNNALSYAVNAIFAAEINYNSIRPVSKKPVPARYETVLPEPYTYASQMSFIDNVSDEPDDYFKGKTFVVYDFEATDKFPDSAEVIEIGALKVVDGKPTEVFNTLTNPGIPIPPEPKKITNIDDDMVADKPSFDKVLPDFYKFTRGAALVGHNIVGYDYPLLKKYADKAGYNFDNDIVDTILLARKHLTELRSYKLEEISKSFNIDHQNAHRAMADVLATFDLLKIVVKRMSNV